MGKPTFIDIFAGCGGLSLGLMQAGWEGLFAVEKDAFAFDTLRTNLTGNHAARRFKWPRWLEQKPWNIEDLLKEHRSELERLRGKVTLLAGGPPCQGFSSAGRRQAADPRNQMVERYLELVETLHPDIVLLENVHGFTLDFVTNSDPTEGSSNNFSSEVVSRLSGDYEVWTTILKASHYGVPQARSRFFLIGLRREQSWPKKNPFTRLRELRQVILARKGVPDRVSSRAAISDLEVGRNGTTPSPDTPGYEAIGYKAPATDYQRAMRRDCQGPPSDTRLARHSETIRARFESIIKLCTEAGRLNVQLSREMREQFGLKKMATRVLDGSKPAPTITSLPDDLIHYSEPRTLTVRENARLQSFPDWFVFRGKYTTGGDRRRREVPRFTQVANAVPPLLAEQIGAVLMEYVAHAAVEEEAA